MVLSATIDKYAYGSLRPRADRRLTVQSLDYDIVAHYDIDQEMPFNGELDLVKAVVKAMCPGCDNGLAHALEQTVALTPASAAGAPVSRQTGIGNGNGNGHANGQAAANGNGHGDVVAYAPGNGHANGNGAAANGNGHGNGYANGNGHGHALVNGVALAYANGNGYANGTGHGNGNGHANGNGNGNGHAHTHSLPHGLDFFIHSDAPPGSGLGSSSTMVVALIGLMQQWQRRSHTHYEVARLAYHIEREMLGIAGGMQDQYAASFGGFNFMEFGESTVVINPLRVDPDVINELEYSLLLCYTGRTRLSANIIRTQVDNYVRHEADVLAAMAELKAITVDMKNALLQGRLNDFGAHLHDAWENKKKMAAQITTSAIDTLYETARAHGALGGKITGAGGGGYMFFYCPFDKKHIVARELERLGAQVVNFTFDRHGLQTWEVPA